MEKQLLNAIRLSGHFIVYMPGYDFNEDVKKVMELLSGAFNGATMAATKMMWKTSTGTSRDDAVMIVSYCTTDQVNTNAPYIIEYISELGKTLGVNIPIDINGNMYFL